MNAISITSLSDDDTSTASESGDDSGTISISELSQHPYLALVREAAPSPARDRGDATPNTTNLGRYISLAETEKMVEDAREELIRYLSFGPGWDGYSGIPFRRDTIRRCVSLLQHYVLRLFTQARISPDEVVPGPASDGSVDVEIVSGNRRLVLTFDPESGNAVNVYAEYETGVVERELDFGEAAMEGLVGWLIEPGHISPPLADH